MLEVCRPCLSSDLRRRNTRCCGLIFPACGRLGRISLKGFCVNETTIAYNSQKSGYLAKCWNQTQTQTNPASPLLLVWVWRMFWGGYYDPYPILLQSLIGFCNEVEMVENNSPSILTLNNTLFLLRNSRYPVYLSSGKQYQYALRVVILFTIGRVCIIWSPSLPCTESLRCLVIKGCVIASSSFNLHCASGWAVWTNQN